MHSKIMRPHGGFSKAAAVVVLTVGAAAIGHTAAEAAGLPPQFFEGAAGGAVLGIFIWTMVRKIRNVTPLVDATSQDRIEFDEPQTAVVTSPPYDAKEYDVFAIETNPDGDFPFKVWVADERGKQQHPFYATGVEFENPE